jgi:hypothetical protein
VHFHGSRNSAHGARANAVFLHRIERRLDQLRMRRQAEIVVRGKIDDRFVIERRVRFGPAFEHAQFSIETLLLQ